MLRRSTQTLLSTSELPYSSGKNCTAWVSNSAFATLPLFSPIQHTVSVALESIAFAAIPKVSDGRNKCAAISFCAMVEATVTAE